MARRTVHVVDWPELDGRRVDALARSISEVGLLHGVVVREPTPAEEKSFSWGGSDFVLVAGFHRAAAYKQLNGSLSEIPFQLCSDAELAHIDENLVRAHLDAREIAELTAKSVAAREAQSKAEPKADRFSDTAPENSSGSRPVRERRKAARSKDGRGRPPRPAVKNEAADQGVHEDTVRRRLRRARGDATPKPPREAPQVKKLLATLRAIVDELSPTTRRKIAALMLDGL